MNIIKKPCPLCRAQADITEVPDKNYSFVLYDCPSCGHYAIDSKLLHKNGSLKLADNKRSRLAILAAERHLHKRGHFFLQKGDKVKSVKNYEQYIPYTLKEFLNDYPSNGVEVFDRILLNLSVLLPEVGKSFRLSLLYNEYMRLFYCSDHNELDRITMQLEELGYFVKKSDGCFIDVNGWRRLKELQKFHLSGKAFLAMWFDAETAPLRSAIKDAVRQAGYSPEELTVDEAHHNDYIMDKVVNMVSDAQFVIADFTCVPEEDSKKGVRGGVYFEAGFARGLGKQVIHTCRDDDESKKRLHFDIGQINTIFWQQGKEPLKVGEGNFVDILRERIIATVGKGPKFKEDSV